MALPGRDLFDHAIRSYRRQALLQQLQGALDGLASDREGTLVRDHYTDEFARVRVDAPDHLAWISLSRPTATQVRAGVVIRSVRDDAELFDLPVLELHPAWQPRDYPVPWMRPVETGEALLDARFAVYSFEGRVVSHVFTPAVKEALVGLHYMNDMPGVGLQTGGKSVAVRRVLPCRDVGPGLLGNLLDRTIGLFRGVESIFEIASDAVIRVIETVAAPVEIRCRVCGEPLDSRPVYCAACETPHHSDCWQYTGRCAIFACGARSFVAVRAATPAPIPVASRRRPMNGT